ncbi:MAG: amidohydrolase [Bacillota bacterium]|nr:MAG: amidohydrolase [Bacillota bacterium]
MIIDFHTHVFPDKLAAHAVESLGAQVKLKPHTDGTLAFTERLMKEQGVDNFVALNIAASPRTEKHVNDFAIEVNKTHYAFGSVHPDSPNALSELDRLSAAGIKGVKFHNEYQNFFVDDEKAFPLYEKIEKLRLAAVFHGGYDPAFPPPLKASPERCARVCAAFPKATFIFAHLGGLALPKQSVKHLKNTAAFIDTAYMAGAFTEKEAEYAIKEFGADRVLFGSDCPWDTPENTLAFLKKLHLSQEETQAILYKNALKILT